jgi:hypothetical protein
MCQRYPWIKLVAPDPTSNALLATNVITLWILLLISNAGVRGIYITEGVL